MTGKLLRNENRSRRTPGGVRPLPNDLAYLDQHETVQELYHDYGYVPLTTSEPDNKGTRG